MEGLEPPRLSALDPKSNAATNYATSALGTAKIIFFSYIQMFFEKYFFINCLRHTILQTKSLSHRVLDCIMTYFRVALFLSSVQILESSFRW